MSPVFKRREIRIGKLERRRGRLPPKPRSKPIDHIAPEPGSSEMTVLVINSSREMAKEITMQLSLRMPASSIMYAPTIDVAKWILHRRKIDLIVSSGILPDGSVSRLKAELEQIASPPDLVVVGDMNLNSAELLSNTGYEFAGVKRIGDSASVRVERLEPGRRVVPVNEKISSLGADLRNDLNNPLQEIVAMVFVAQSTEQMSESTQQALLAIDSAAKNMATVVKSIEDKIRGVYSEAPTPGSRL